MKGNLKKILVNKIIQTRASQMFSAPDPAVPKTATGHSHNCLNLKLLQSPFYKEISGSNIIMIQSHLIK